MTFCRIDAEAFAWIISMQNVRHGFKSSWCMDSFTVIHFLKKEILIKNSRFRLIESNSVSSFHLNLLFCFGVIVFSCRLKKKVSHHLSCLHQMIWLYSTDKATKLNKWLSTLMTFAEIYVIEWFPKTKITFNSNIIGNSTFNSILMICICLVIIYRINTAMDRLLISNNHKRLAQTELLKQCETQ